MNSKNKNLDLAIKIGFMVFSCFVIYALCWHLNGTELRSIDSGDFFISPTTLFLFTLKNKIFEPFRNMQFYDNLSNLPMVAKYFIEYVLQLVELFLVNLNVTIYCGLYGAFAQKIFYGNAFQKEYYRRKNIFNLYAKLILVWFCLSPLFAPLIGWGVPRTDVSWFTVTGVLVAFLSYHAIGLARKKAAQTVSV